MPHTRQPRCCCYSVVLLGDRTTLVSVKKGDFAHGLDPLVCFTNKVFLFATRRLPAGADSARPRHQLQAFVLNQY